PARAVAVAHELDLHWISVGTAIRALPKFRRSTAGSAPATDQEKPSARKRNSAERRFAPPQPSQRTRFMIRSVSGPKIPAFVAAAALVAVSALPAAALFAVQPRGNTFTVTQLDQTKLLVFVGAGGGVLVDDGVSAVGYPSATNLVVRGSDAVTLSQIEVRLDGPL